MAHHRYSHGTELPWRLWGRRVRPLAFAAMLACTGVAIGFRYEGPGQAFDFSSAQGVLESAAAATAVVLFAIGWGLNWRRVAEWGLLVAAGVFAGRAWLILLTSGIDAPATWVSGAWAIASAGSYLLEVTAPPTPTRAGERE